MNAPLQKYDAACLAIAAARATDEVKTIHDKHVALQAYARQAKNRELEIDAAEIRMRAQRRIGELMETQRETVGLAVGSRGKGRPKLGGSEKDPPKPDQPTLADAGIDKHLADRARKLAAVPQAEFEAKIGEWRERVSVENERVTTDLLKAGARAQAEAIKAQPAATPAGKFSTIVIDPPWQMEKIERDVRPNQAGFDYPTMSEEEIAAFNLAAMAADDCHLFCWTTQKFMPSALRIIEEWGFRYVLNMVWRKNGGFQPIGLPQYNCEFVIYARRGTPKFIDTKAFPCCFDGVRREHSRKPVEFYQMIRRVTAEPRVDVFSRGEHEGFAQFGNETDKFEGAA